MSIKILFYFILDKKVFFLFLDRGDGGFMESVRVDEQGQIVLPCGITEEFGFKKGEEIIVLKKKGYFILKPLSLDPWKEIQNIMDGEAEKIGWSSEDDVLAFMKKNRA